MGIIGGSLVRLTLIIRSHTDYGCNLNVYVLEYCKLTRLAITVHILISISSLYFLKQTHSFLIAIRHHRFDEYSINNTTFI
jgi:hypothetical protein